MNIDLKKAAKSDFEKYFLRVTNNSVFGKHSDIKLLTSIKRRDYLVSEPNYHKTKFSIENFLVIEIKRKQNRYLSINQSI